jgi:hypothetical protein
VAFRATLLDAVVGVSIRYSPPRESIFANLVDRSGAGGTDRVRHCGPAQPADGAGVALWCAPAYYTGLSGDCPVLKSPESVRFTGSRTGKRFRLPRKDPARELINCGWRPPSGKPPWVTITVSLFLEPATAHETAEHEFARSREFAMNRAEGLPSHAVRVVDRAGPYGSTFVVADADDNEVTGDSDDLSQTTLVGNAVVWGSLFDRKDTTQSGSARADELVAELTATSEAITAEIAGQLVSRA